MTSTSDWLHFHQTNPSSTATEAATPYTTTSVTDLYFSGRASDPTDMGVSTPISSMNSPPPTSQAQLGPAPGRVSKPARKRTRASRRTPTTLLNTDTTNFRAMVQQFTGGPSSNFDFHGPGPQMYSQGYGVQLPMGQLQQPALGPLQYNSNNHSNNIMFMQRTMGENYNPNEGINMNMRINGSGGGSSSSENRSNNSFHY